MTAARKIEGTRQRAMDIGRNRRVVTVVVLTRPLAVTGLRLAGFSVCVGGGCPSATPVR